MASVSLIEGLAKKFLNLVPRPFYTEAAQKLVHEICETIYKELENNGDRIPRSEIIQIVKDFVTNHLNNPPQNPNENPMGIRDAITDSLAKTTLEVYNDDVVNMILLQKILSEEIDPAGNPMPDGIFYKLLQQSVDAALDPSILEMLKKGTKASLNAIAMPVTVPGKMLLKGVGQIYDKGKDVIIDQNKKAYAKNVLAALPNVNIVDTPSQSSNDNSMKGGDIYSDVGKNISSFGSDFAAKNPLTAAAGMALGAAALSGSLKGKGSGNGNGGTTNIGYEPNDKGVLPYIQTNCNGVGLGLPGIDLDFLSGLFDGLKEPIAEELVKKIKERLPEKTTDSLTVKRDIYEKILLVIQGHLQSQQGKDMLLGHINKVIGEQIKDLTEGHEIKKRIIKVIFKNKKSEIYKKLIEIIVKHTNSQSDENKLEKASNGGKEAEVSKNTKPAYSKNTGLDTDNITLLDKINGGDPPAEKNNNFNTKTDKVIIDFYKWTNETIIARNGYPDSKNAIKEKALKVFKEELEKQKKIMEKENIEKEGQAKKGMETIIQEVAIAKIIESIPPAKKEPEVLNVRLITDNDVNQQSPANNTENGGNDDKKKAAAIDEVSKKLDNKSRGGLSPTKSLPPLKVPPHMITTGDMITTGGNPNTKKRRTKHNKTKKKNRKQKK